jgi:hypothetical protein
MKYTGVPIHLGQNTSDSIFGTVGFDDYRIFGIVVSQDRSRRESLLQRVEGLLTVIRPSERNSFSGKMMEGSGNMGVVSDESPVKVSETKKRLDLLNGGRSGPIADGGKFGWVHSDAVF